MTTATKAPRKRTVKKSAAARTGSKATAKKSTTTKAKAKKSPTARKSTATKKASASRKTTRTSTASKPAAKKSSRATASKPAAKKSTRATASKPAAKKSPRATARKTNAKKATYTPKVVTKGEIPMLDLEQYEVKQVVEAGVKDTFFGSTRYAWIGSGQCGGRLVKSFYDLGYHKVLAVNTTHHDLDLLELPKSQKFLMDMGERGAGKDMKRGRQAVSETRQDVLHNARQLFGTEVDHIMVCFGAGGGTGGGSALELINVAKDYAHSIGKTDPNRCVGAVMTLPTVGEASSPQVAQNAYQVAQELGQLASEGQISPLIIVDNEKISRMYPGMTVKQFWPSINSTVASLFDIFNRLSSLSSPYTSFDPVDYQSIMRTGGCAIMGLTKVSEYKDRFALSGAVKQNLEKTLLSDGFDLATAKVAGCTVVGGKQMMANTPSLQDNINFAFDVLADITGNATIHRGLYEDSRESLRVYTIIGGLDFPTSRIKELLTP